MLCSLMNIIPFWKIRRKKGSDMYIFIYSIIVFCATVIGAISGLGGGVIIKPLFDMMALHSSEQIGFYSSCCVFTMCFVSIWRQKELRHTISKSTVVLISVGSIIGGILGNNLFYTVLSIIKNNSKVRFIQSLLLFIIIVFILLHHYGKNHFPSYRVANRAAIFCVGCILGTISTFLGIGGGPLNIALFTILFGCSAKQAACYSIIAIFFSQISKLTATLYGGALYGYDLTPLPYMIFASILGGLIGTYWSQKAKDKNIEQVYIGTMFFLMAICMYNMFA